MRANISFKTFLFIGCLLTSIFSVGFIYKMSFSSQKSEFPTSTTTIDTVETNNGCIIETLTAQKMVITEIPKEVSQKYRLKKGDLVENINDPKIIRYITAELRDVYMIRCLEGGTMRCEALDWTLCPKAGCPTPGRKGEITKL
jgi:hypothetical protein